MQLDDLHFSTFVVMLFVQLILIAVNCGADLRYSDEPGQRFVVAADYGWPLHYGSRSKFGDDKDLWRLNQLEQISAWPLTVNVVFGLTLTFLAGYLWQRRAIRRDGWYRLNRTDILVVVAVFGCVGLFLIRTYNDNRVLAKLSRQNPGVTWNEDRIGGRLPAFLFWLERNPTSYPIRVTSIEVSGTLTPEDVILLADFNGLLNLKIAGSFNQKSLQTLDQCRSLMSLELQMRDTALLSRLPKLPQLQQIRITTNDVLEGSLSDLKRIANISGLSLSFNGRFSPRSGLSDLSALEFLQVEGDVGNTVISQLKTLSQLRDLVLLQNCLPEDTATINWKPLSDLNQLLELRLSSWRRLDSQFDGSAIAELPRLKIAAFTGHAQINDEDLNQIAKLPNLSHLSVHSDKLTDACESTVQRLMNRNINLQMERSRQFSELTWRRLWLQSQQSKTATLYQR